MATAAQINAITALYVGYFDRAPDPAGLQFWIDQIDGGREFNTIAADFAASPEATGLYPFLTTPDVSSPTAFITSIYANLFDRAPDAEGLAFWSGVLAEGTVDVADFIEAIILGARDDADAGTFDAATLDNKVEVGLYYAQQTGEIPGFVFDAAARAASIDVINGVTSDDASVVAALAEVDAYVAGGVVGQTFTLTNAADNIIGTDNNDTITGLVDDDDGAGANPLINTFGPGDVIDGGAGVDTLVLTQIDDNDNFGDGFGAGATVTNVEILKIVQADSNDADFDLSGFSGLEQIVADMTYDTSYEFYNLQEELVSITMDGSRAESTERDMDFYLYDMSNSLYTGDDDTLVINVINAGSEESGSSAYFSHSNQASDEVFENYSVMVGGDDNYLFIENDTGADDAEVTTLTAANVAGNSGSLYLDLDEQDSLETVDASAMTGGFRFEFGSSTDAEQEITVTTGTGDDNIELNEGAFTVDTGAGDDRVELFAGSGDELGDDVLDGGEGTDIIAGDIDTFADADLDDSTISNFEVIEFSNNASADVTVDVAAYEGVIISDNDIGNGFTVTIDGTNGQTVAFENNDQSSGFVVFTSTGSSDELTLSFEEEDNDTFFDLDVTDIETVNFVTSTEDDDMSFTNVDISGVETLTFSGEGDIDLNGIADDGALTTLDLTAMTGVFDNTGSFLDDAGLDDIIIGNLGNGSYIDLLQNANNTFSFTGTLDNDISIGGFEDGVGGDILDFSSFGVANFADLTIVDNGGSTEITADEFDGMITLVGVPVLDLDGAANFVFA